MHVSLIHAVYRKKVINKTDTFYGTESVARVKANDDRLRPAAQTERARLIEWLPMNSNDTIECHLDA